MPYIPHTQIDISRILEAVGVDTVEDLLACLPAASRVSGPLDLPEGLSEQELKKALKDLSARNSTTEEYISFLGAGAYHHYIPSAVDHLISRSEFCTSYTPYQPEVSQGTLQAIFEYQTLVCQLTSMDVSNASLYDGASAVAEAVLMAMRITRRKGVVLSAALHPEYRQTVKTYLKGAGDHVFEALYCTEQGATLSEAVEAAIDNEPACLVVQHPNFFGSLEEVEELAGQIHKKGGLLIVVVTEPVSLGLLKPPGEMGADIVVGEMQSFGNPLSYGGPYLGFMAAKKEHVRQMPGRLVGQTRDTMGRRAFCLTFATREQHIRRERATSNICTNHGLNALAAAIHLVSLGRTGLADLARVNISKAAYLKERLMIVDGVKEGFSRPTFNEFTVRIDRDPGVVLKALLKRRIIGGLALERFYPELSGHLLLAATEMNSKKDMDSLADSLQEAIS